MTIIKLFVDEDRYIGFEVEGHSGYADSGADVVCAAISALTQTCVLGLQAYGFELDSEKDDEEGYFYACLSNEPTKTSDAILTTTVLGLYSIAKKYPNYVRITE